MTSKLYPGMRCNSAEIFVDDDSVQVISNGSVKPFAEISFPHYQLLKEAVYADPEVLNELIKMHPTSEAAQIEQFAKCRFGGIDFYPDIKDNQLSDGDYWDCPLKGICAAEGIICRSVKYNGHSLSKIQISLIKLLVTGMTNATIALMLEIAEGTMHLLKKELYRIFDVQTKQELALKAQQINLI
jgi:DNA-binding NarL/FixJ family response regulator